MKAIMKYLGLHLDSEWRFSKHFACLAPKVCCTANALARLTPNLGNPKKNARRLYMNVVHAVASMSRRCELRAGARSSFSRRGNNSTPFRGWWPLE